MMDPWVLLGGVISLLWAGVMSAILVFAVYRITIRLSSQLAPEAALRGGNRSMGLLLGTIVVCEASLLRHALFPAMALIRDLLVRSQPLSAIFWALAYAALSFVVIGSLSIAAVMLALWLVHRMTGSLDEHGELMKDNLAVGILIALVVVAVTIVLNGGVEDFSLAIIPTPEGYLPHPTER